MVKWSESGEIIRFYLTCICLKCRFLSQLNQFQPNIFLLLHRRLFSPQSGRKLLTDNIAVWVDGPWVFLQLKRIKKYKPRTWSWSQSPLSWMGNSRNQEISNKKFEMVPMQQRIQHTSRQWGYTILHGLKCIHWETVFVS